MNQNDKRNLKMRKVAEDIIKMPVNKRMIKTLKEKFYNIMRENGIKEGEWSKNGNGRCVANYEWTMCKTLFLNQIRGALEMSLLFDAPKDLDAYGERPTVEKEIDDA
ncbi:MAG: hypothetical protein GOV02_02990 [Candidatus Aenigmarchaeota archaeon]|nr:hypothetical protein [Candidatus Aenigmarchaeota archaeon]